MEIKSRESPSQQAAKVRTATFVVSPTIKVQERDRCRDNGRIHAAQSEGESKRQ